CFVSDFEHALVIAYRTLDPGEEDLIPIQAAGIADPAIAYASAQNVELTVREEALEGEAGVDLEADQIAVGWGIADAKEGGQTLRRRIGAAPQHLVRHQIGPEIAAVHRGNAIARRVRERAPRAIMAQIGEFCRVIPGTEFDVAERGRRNRLLVERIGTVDGWHKATLADQEVGAARVADLRVPRSRRRRIAVEERSRQGQITRRCNPDSGAWRREWIARPAARQVGRQDVRTTERRVDKACRVLADVKLVVEGDLAYAKRGLVVEKFLLKPHIVKARRGERLDRADRQQVADRVSRQA